MTEKSGPGADEEENAAELKLGSEFEQAKCLMISEVAVVLDAYLHKPGGSGNEEAPNVVFDKCLEYCKRFVRFETPEAVRSVRELLSSQDLYEFEVGVVGNLVPETAAEAKSLVPTLVDSRELSDETIDKMLQQLGSFKNL